ncbi:YrrS family protein [Bacillus sp. REN10]|uniref:YrrS family protein n=1 Tax=Bacillus sp. REN10 TaxID=2782541 RepID=UPI00193C4621|nr:YrrS family protein [Bacillus sp. REN10]
MATRAERNSKRKKTNRVLNTAIAVVVLLIVVVAFTIFSGGNDEAAKKPVEKKPATEQNTASNTDENKAEEVTVTDDSDNKKEENKEEKKDKEKQEEKKDKKVVKNSDEPNVEQEIVDPNWKGVGTSQTGEHNSSFDSNSPDWQEKLNALSYATGISEGEMVVWFVKGQGPNDAVGTVSPKSNTDEAYRVFLTWVDGEGWKPTKMYKLEQNDKGRF